MEEGSLNDKTVFITGGNSGIGLATALMFAKEGANVAIFSRREEKNSAALAQIERSGGKGLAFFGDVSDENILGDAVNRCADAFGGLHYAFNNAGLAQRSTPLYEQTVDQYNQIMDVNVKGVWLSMRAQIPIIQQSGGGCVVNSGSVASHVGVIHAPLYTAAKHAIVGLTKSVAMEFARSNVRVNAISPAYVKTDMMNRLTKGKRDLEDKLEAAIPMGRSGREDEIAKSVLYLCKDATWTTGHCLLIDGGFTAQ